MLILEMARSGIAVAARHAATETAAASRIPAHLQEATLRKGSLPPTLGKEGRCRSYPRRRKSRTGIQPLFPDAIMYRTKFAAEGRFCAVDPTAGAVNHLRVIVTPLRFVQNAADFSRKALLFVSVAILALQDSQSGPQQAINRFIYISLNRFLSIDKFYFD